ncbi:hypothetical protein DL93DRAFT_2030852, partial [Clavulina sp. PMI_390]
PDVWFHLAVFTQILRPCDRVRSLPLSDVHVPRYQVIDPTERFSAITVLSLRDARGVIDDVNIIEIKDLHQLVALDLSSTTISEKGIKNLSRSLRHGDDGDSLPLQGPWKLRILNLQGCARVNNHVCEALADFPLLCLVGKSIPSTL